MALLFTLYAAVICLILYGKRKAALILALVNIVLCLLMFWHDVTIHLPLNL